MFGVMDFYSPNFFHVLLSKGIWSLLFLSLLWLCIVCSYFTLLIDFIFSIWDSNTSFLLVDNGALVTENMHLRTYAGAEFNLGGSFNRRVFFHLFYNLWT